MYSHVETVLIFLFIAILIVFGVFLNSIVLIVYCKFFSKYTSVSLLIFLALTNLFSSMVVLPMIGIEELTTFDKTLIYCNLHYFFSYTTSSLSIVCLVLIAYECFQIINSTKKIINITKRTKLIGFLLTMGAFIYAIVSCLFVKINTYNKCTGTSFTLNVFVTCTLFFFYVTITVYYAKIYYIVRQNRRKVTFFASSGLQKKKLSQVSVISHTASTTPQNAAEMSKIIKKNFKVIRNTWNSSRKFILVTVLYLVTWSPWTLVKIFKFKDSESDIVSFFLETLCFTNNIFNPLIYSFMSKTFRNDLMEIVRSIKNKISNKCSLN